MIREAEAPDARAVLDYIDHVSGETDFLTFGPGEFELSEAEEATTLRRYQDAGNQLYVLGLLDDTIVGTLIFTGGRRPRVRHSGQISMSVRKQHWGQGIGSGMLDTLVDWARATRLVTKLNLRVRTDNWRAILLYERKGFVKEGTLHKEILLEGVYYAHHWMGLEL